VPGRFREKPYQTVPVIGAPQRGSVASRVAPTVVPASVAGSLGSTGAFARLSLAGGVAVDLPASAPAGSTSTSARASANAHNPLVTGAGRSLTGQPTNGFEPFRGTFIDVPSFVAPF
jgi:hypothetical protein